MKCPNCGEEIANGSKFCGFCGYQLSEEEIKQGSSNGAKNVLNNVMTVLQNTDKKILGIGALVVCLAIGLVVFFTTRKTTINLQDYVTVEITGADGYGQADVDFDYDQFEIDVLAASGLTDIVNQIENSDEDPEDYLSSSDYQKVFNCAYAIYSVYASNSDVVLIP
ncbi:MAG: zinc ribbon domain-containing protein [Erysipelotrichaceae bacterium]|nr:zinc ribbon domain-containing protein [Erysipelotrichaceae bacterium]